MQKLLQKKSILFLLFFTHLGVVAQPQSNTFLHQADSLFEQGQFEEAQKLYVHEWEVNKRYSPQMLLKMGYIEEQAGNIPMTMFYYNQYLDLTHNTHIIPKIQELSELHFLKGYEFSDVEYFVSLYRRYYYPIIFTIILLGLPYFIYLIVRALQKKKWGSRPIGFLLIMGIVFLLNNYDVIPDRAIIVGQTCLMDSPAAGSECTEQIEAGNRVTVLGKEGGIWYRVLWDNQTLFVRNKHLKIIQSGKI
jgi:tetratricopeptide (TPR) repeat protein